MYYNKNCKFIVDRDNDDIVAKKNKSNFEPKKIEIFEENQESRSICGKTLSEKDFFHNENRNGIFSVKIYYNSSEKRKSIKYYIKIEENKIIKQRRKFPRDLSGETQKFPDNLFLEDKVEIGSMEYLKLLDFFIIKNPSIKDKKPISVKFYNIKEKWGDDCWKKEDSLKQKLIESFDCFENSIRKFNSAKDSKQSIKFLGLDDTKLFDDKVRIAFEDVCNNIFLSIFRHIRNGFAHGRFYCYKFEKTKMIFIEDVNKDNVTARITIPISLLLNWIDIITMKP